MYRRISEKSLLFSVLRFSKTPVWTPPDGSFAVVKRRRPKKRGERSQCSELACAASAAMYSA
jgi:hypothetical protein